MEGKAEAGHACRDGCDEEPFRPAVETLPGKQAEHDNESGEDAGEADQRVNYGVNAQDHGVPITSISTRNVTSPFGYDCSIRLGTISF